jgi:hypothetical protein
MNNFLDTNRRLFLIFLLIGIVGCASVPKEIVELSYRTGEDLTALHESYDNLIGMFFEKMRAERVSYLNDIWYPRFLENWMERGQLVSVAKGEVIWSDEQEKLIPTPPNTDPKEAFHTLRDWVDYALYAYDVKEEALLKPLNDEELALRRDVQMAFLRMMRANAIITTHLNSIRKVQEVENEALEALYIKDLRNRIDSTLVNISEKAAKELNKIRRIDESVDNLDEQIKSLIEEIKQ